MNDQQRAPLQRYSIAADYGSDDDEYADPDGEYLRVADLASGEVLVMLWDDLGGGLYVLNSKMFDVSVCVCDEEKYEWVFNGYRGRHERRGGFPSPGAAMSDAEQWLIQQCGAFILSAIRGREIIEGQR